MLRSEGHMDRSEFVQFYRFLGFCFWERERLEGWGFFNESG